MMVSEASSVRLDGDLPGGKSVEIPCCSPFGATSESGTASRWPRLLVWLWVIVFWVLVFTEPIGAAVWFIATWALAMAWLMKGERRHDRA